MLTKTALRLGGKFMIFDENGIEIGGKFVIFVKTKFGGNFMMNCFL